MKDIIPLQQNMMEQLLILEKPKKNKGKKIVVKIVFLKNESKGKFNQNKTYYRHALPCLYPV